MYSHIDLADMGLPKGSRKDEDEEKHKEKKMSDGT
jgi:hypothetical protein